MKNLKFIILSLLVFAVLSVDATAQMSREFQIGARLMQQQNYTEALPLLKNAYADNPNDILYLDRLIECYIQLKQYDEALEVSNAVPKSFQNYSEAEVLKGKLYHFKGDTSMAFKIWTENVENNPAQFQIYINTAQAMAEVRAYKEAIKIYQKARSVFNNQDIFILDIANTYMLDSDYDNAIKEWLNLVERRPEQISSIQSTLLRYNDPILYDITILEIEDRLGLINSTNQAYGGLFQLQIWLLQENRLFRRALAAALRYESSTSNYNYALFNLGRQLNENKEYDLAIQAYNYYVENGAGEIKWRSMNELANVYSGWAKDLDLYNLDFKNEKDSLIQKSYNIIEQLESDGRNYSRFSNVLIKKAELALDFLYDTEIAQSATNTLSEISNMGESAEFNYLEGRIHLFKGDFTRARIAFTKSNKIARIGDLAEKTRYFLALTDFYAGDYEFATIQLKSLGRQNTSFYANDALQLRLWLQKGTSKDSLTNYLDPFASALFNINKGNIEEGVDILNTQLNEKQRTPLFEDILILLSSESYKDADVILTELNDYLATGTPSALKERLLWEQAKWNEILFNNGNTQNTTNPEDLYEELIIEYPEGFYAPEARKRLTQFSKINS